MFFVDLNRLTSRAHAVVNVGSATTPVGSVIEVYSDEDEVYKAEVLQVLKNGWVDTRIELDAPVSL